MSATPPPSQRRRTMVVVGVCAAVLAGVIALAAVTHSTPPGDNTTAQAFVLPRLGASGTTSLASFRGHPVIVNFFASWCTECAHELPVFAHDAEALRGRAVVVEVNALETGDGLAFARRFHLGSSTAAVLHDVGGREGSGLYESLGGTGAMPITAFYSEQGNLVDTHVGAYNAASLAAQLQQQFGLAVQP